MSFQGKDVAAQARAGIAGAFNPADLRDPDHARRTTATAAALEKITAIADRRVDELRGEIGAIGVRCQQDLAAAQSILADTNARLHQAYIRDATKLIAPLASAYLAVPTRPNTTAIMDTRNELATRERRELVPAGNTGILRVDAVIGHLFAEVAIKRMPGAVNALSQNVPSSEFVEAVGAVAVAAAGASAVSMVYALSRLETAVDAIATRAMGTAPVPHCAARWAVVKLQDRGAAEAFDRDAAQVNQRAFESSYGAPARVNARG